MRFLFMTPSAHMPGFNEGTAKQSQRCCRGLGRGFAALVGSWPGPLSCASGLYRVGMMTVAASWRVGEDSRAKPDRKHFE